MCSRCGRAIHGAFYEWSSLIRSSSCIVSASGGNLQKAEHHHSDIRKLVTPVELHDICIPGLHLDLGIFSWMDGALCAEAQKIDKKLLVSKRTGLSLEGTDSTTIAALVNAFVQHTAAVATKDQTEAQHLLHQLQYTSLLMHTYVIQSVSLQTVAATIHCQWKEKLLELDWCWLLEHNASCVRYTDR